VDKVTLFTHARHSDIEVRRFMIEARASLRLRGITDSIESRVHFVDGAARVGIGAVAHSDGLRFTIRLPEGAIIASNDGNASKVRGFRAAYFRHLVLEDGELSEYANSFQRDWLQQAYLSALISWAIREGITLKQSVEAMSPVVERAATKVLQTIFESKHSPDEADGEDTNDGDPDAIAPGTRDVRLRDSILALFAIPTVVACLERVAKVLWEDAGVGWERWARERYLVTIGGALLSACHEIYPEAGEDSLLLDVDGVASMRAVAQREVGRTAEIWLTETAIGGGGVIEEIGRRYVDDPQRFYRLVDSALGPSNREITDTELTTVCRLACSDTTVADALSAVRNAPSHSDTAHAVEALEALLEERGVLVTRSVLSAMHVRLTRPGANSAVDRLLHQSIVKWQEYEERLGVEIDLRVFAYLQSGDGDVRNLLGQVVPGLQGDPVASLHAIYGLLWPRGHAVRAMALAYYNPFGTLPDSDRLLVMDHVVRRIAAVDVSDPNWRSQVAASLRGHGHAFLCGRLDERRQLSEAITLLLVEPVEIEFLRLYPRVDGVQRERDLLITSLSVPEVIQ